MNLHTRAAPIGAIREAARECDFVLSTDALDSYDERVEQSWKLDRFLRNPVALWSHDSRALPIGQWKSVRVEGGALRGTLKFATKDANPLAEQAWQSVLQGTLRAVSVGFRPGSVRTEEIGGRDVTVLSENDLYECSLTPVPANPEALAELRAKAAGGGHADSDDFTSDAIRDIERFDAMRKAKDDADYAARFAPHESDELIAEVNRHAREAR